jgi:hypothetical protein
MKQQHEQFALASVVWCECATSVIRHAHSCPQMPTSTRRRLAHFTDSEREREAVGDEGGAGIPRTVLLSARLYLFSARDGRWTAG